MPAENENKRIYSWRVLVLLSLVLVLSVAYSFAPVFSFSFVNWDDPMFVLNELHIRGFTTENVKWMFTSLGTGNWSPVAWLSLAMDYHFWGLEAAAYHLHNLLIHLINTVLVFALSLTALRRADCSRRVVLWAAFWASILFGLHPIHVESVAWVTDRVDLYCCMFYFSSLLFYLRYVGGRGHRKLNYVVAVLFFSLSLASKSMAVTLPAVLLILDVWPLSRLRSAGLKFLMVEKIPFFILSLVLATVTLWARISAGAVSSMGHLPLDYRVMNALFSPVFYLLKMSVPYGLCVLYPIYLHDTFSWAYVLSSIIFVFFTAFFFWTRHKLPGLLAAWLFYIVTLLPSLGLIAVGSQAAADRYTYIPSLAPFLGLGFLLARWIGERKFLVFVSMALIVLALSAGTRKQLSYWKDSTALWEHELTVYPRNVASAYSGLADAYRENGRFEESLQLFEYAIRNSPSFAFLYNGKGIALVGLAKFEDAESAFKETLAHAVEGGPDAAWAHCHLDILYSRQGRLAEAERERSLALAANPKDAFEHAEEGKLYEKYGLDEPALAHYQKAMAICPTFTEVQGRMDAIAKKRKANVNP